MAEEVKFQKVNGKSLDIEAVDKEKLKKIFPQCFNEGKLDINKLLSLCGEYIDNDYEKYKFEWKGKSECYRIAGKRSTGTLRPCPEESVDFENTNNLYIEGDNLEVLKLLQTAYYRKVKMIYIDPPYNTGNDFVYEDDFKDPLAKYKEITSQTTKSNPETMGRYHTNWLNMMFPRLRLAANLLRDDGVIFISIDDNEVTNLRRLCDEVFGEENFVADFQWKKKSTTTNVEGVSVSSLTEHILCYKKAEKGINNRIVAKEERSYPFSDEQGNYRKTIIEKKNEGEYARKTMEFSIIGHKPREGKRWQIGEDKARALEKLNRFVYEDGIVKLKIYDFEDKDTTSAYPNLLFEHGSTDSATKDLKELLGGNYFSNPKPYQLIKQLLVFTDVETKDQIILDFFSGSATTAHAVMQLNAEDGGNRQFIMVQLPELTAENSEAFKAGYKNICEIGKERIRRAGAKIKEEYLKNHLALTGHSSTGGEQFPSQGGVAAQADGVVKSRNTQNYLSLPYNAEHPEVDTGFKVLKLDTSNLVKWDDTPTDSEEDLFNRMDGMVKSLKNDRSELDVVFEVMLKLGIPPTYKVNEISVNGRKVYSIGDDGLVLICLDSANGGIAPEDISAMCDLAPAKIVAAEEAFKDDIALSNAYYISKDKGIEIELL